MDQRSTTGAPADATTVDGATTEFEPDVMDLLVEALRAAVERESPVVGTDTVLAALVMGDTDAGAATAPGIRASGGLSGLISGRAGHGWANDDEGGVAPAATEADALEVDTAWREARWRLGLGSRGSAPRSDRARPGMTGALRTCLLLAIASARAEGTISVRCRHVARALVDLPGGRAREALLLRGLDPAAAATALDALNTGTSARSESPESRGVTLLRRAGTLGRSGNRLSRAITSWTSGVAQNGSPVLFAVSVEAVRQAVRRGHTEAEPVDLLLGVLALDRALTVAGRSLPESLATANAAGTLLRLHGVRQASLPRAAIASAPVSGAADITDVTRVRLSAAADRAMAVARLTAAEHRSPTAGTVHLLAALLGGPTAEAEAGPETEGAVAVARLLRASGQVDTAGLLAELRLRLAG
ncbi:Clp protease N-terminal domain-containing protein [Streptomyces sp. WI04-05B]|uniref:Clp protease N-terminal domain-containing protein n=1 Tax=Streptomyces TaxID=1883 RepID=UPI0029B46A21|nr:MULTISPECIES: Clp protease N-terminal domain-containing protein [unclassified Streptomyces]MDX2540427.1 Clp protease N-terminal domain-containing protein [Streptomyces sp. WI04-05B]MDX2585140.1 Clp protease N-terminal domain-containing protein [Streptomyces sp. WI04-05A]